MLLICPIDRRYVESLVINNFVQIFQTDKIYCCKEVRYLIGNLRRIPGNNNKFKHFSYLNTNFEENIYIQKSVLE